MVASPLRRLALALAGTVMVLAGAGLVAPFAAPAVAAAPSCVTAEGEVATGQVLVVVGLPSGPVSACAAPGGSGIDVLRRAGFTLTTYGFTSEGGDAAVCAIGAPGGGEQVGCQTGPSCLKCQSPLYWVYSPCYRYSQVGGGETHPAGGTVEGWRWSSTREWDVGFPARCDTDGDDVVTPPPTRPTTPDRPGGGGSAHGVPGTTPSRPGPGATTSTTAPRGGGPTTSSPSTTTTTTTTALDGATTSSPRPPTTAPGEERASGGAGPGAGTVAVSDGGGGGGSALVPLAGTGAIVAALGAVALRVRRSRRAEVA